MSNDKRRFPVGTVWFEVSLATGMDIFPTLRLENIRSNVLHKESGEIDFIHTPVWTDDPNRAMPFTSKAEAEAFADMARLRTDGGEVRIMVERWEQH